MGKKIGAVKVRGKAKEMRKDGRSGRDWEREECEEGVYHCSLSKAVDYIGL